MGGVSVVLTQALVAGGEAGLVLEAGQTVGLWGNGSEPSHQSAESWWTGACWVEEDLDVAGGAGGLGRRSGGGLEVKDMQVSLLLHLPLQGGVPVVLNGVVGPEDRQPAASHTCEHATRPAALTSAYLPGSSLEMSAQRFPSSRWAWHTMRSSSRVQLLFFTVGFRWLCQRSRHCFPFRVCRCLAMSDQRFMPYFWTSSMTCGTVTSHQCQR
ncbi:uncharacterized protein LOC142398480 [Odontesthes bonariensis]|uniref:uncharacterized protein LOC142398480 n=1 Tax=Odontesthes bonariensis TaxID=219752 RepID=UPI003F58F77B